MMGSASNSFNSGLLDGCMTQQVIKFESKRKGTSSRSLEALNAVRVVLGHEKFGAKGLQLLEQITDKNTMDEILGICANSENELHSEVVDLASLPMFRDLLIFSHSGYHQADPENLTALMRVLEATSAQEGSSTAAVIAQPLESFAVFYIITHGALRPGIFTVFNSHLGSTSGVGEGALAFFTSLTQTVHYISDFLPKSDSPLFGDAERQSQPLGHHFVYVYLAASTGNPVKDHQKSLYDANLEILELRRRLSDAEAIVRALTDENLDHIGGIPLRNNTLSSGQILETIRSLPENTRDRSTSRAAARVSSTDLTQSKGSAALDASESPIVDDVTHVSSKDAPSVEHMPPAGYSHNGSSPIAGPSTHPTLFPQAQTWPAHISPSQESRLDEKGKKSTVDGSGRSHVETTEEDIGYEASLRIRMSQTTRLQQVVRKFFKCAICLETHPEDSVFRMDTCEHEFCRGCARNLVLSKLDERKYPILCPTCQIDGDVPKPGEVTEDLIEQLGLTEEQHAIWVSLELSKFSVVLDCPKCRCSPLVDIDDYANTKILICPLRHCGHTWCKDCGTHVELGSLHSCDGRLELNCLMDSLGWRYCPGCKTPTEKRGGCNHMTCPVAGCNSHFCYLCGKSIVRSARREVVGSALRSHYGALCSMYGA